MSPSIIVLPLHLLPSFFCAHLHSYPPLGTAPPPLYRFVHTVCAVVLVWYCFSTSWIVSFSFCIQSSSSLSSRRLLSTSAWCRVISPFLRNQYIYHRSELPFCPAVSLSELSHFGNVFLSCSFGGIVFTSFFFPSSSTMHQNSIS